jgi:hypothetical protein
MNKLSVRLVFGLLLLIAPLAAVGGVGTSNDRGLDVAFPLDLAASPPTALDANGWPSNPRWNYQLTYPDVPNALKLCGGLPTDRHDWLRARLGTPSCVTEDAVDFDDGVAFRVRLPGYHVAVPIPVCNLGALIPKLSGGTIGRGNVFKFHGHLNWLQPVTFAGFASGLSHSNNPFDHDHDINLATPNEPAMTNGNQPGSALVQGVWVRQKALHLEFDSRETVDHYDALPWWRTFKRAQAAFVDHHYAVASGVLGLDAEHTGGSELHPVWALAIAQKGEPDRDPNNDRWSFFIRNWGDEGFCSRRQWTSGPDRITLTLKIPWWAGATGATPTRLLMQKSQGAGAPQIAVVAKSAEKGIYLSVALPAGADKAWAAGEIQIRWTHAKPKTPPPVPPASAPESPSDLDEYASKVVAAVATKPLGRSGGVLVAKPNPPFTTTVPPRPEPVRVQAENDQRRVSDDSRAYLDLCHASHPARPKRFWKWFCAGSSKS